MPKEYHVLGQLSYFRAQIPAPYEILHFYMYEEMGITPPTLYRTMITEEQADSMWANTATKYWKLEILGRYLQPKPVAAPSIDTTTPTEV
jgi:hypothetical protein